VFDWWNSTGWVDSARLAPSARRVTGGAGDADRGGEAHLQSVETERFAQPSLDLLGEPTEPGVEGEARSVRLVDDEELVDADPADLDPAFAEVAEAVGDLHQDRVARGGTERLVDGPEVVDVDVEHADTHGAGGAGDVLHERPDDLHDPGS
jgi:hypothetical protein